MNNDMPPGINMTRLINLLSVFHGEKRNNFIEIDDLRILSQIVDTGKTGKCISVTDIVNCKLFGSPPTVQRRIKKLIRNGYIELSKCEKDQRKKCLVPTNEANIYLNDLTKYVIANI